MSVRSALIALHCTPFLPAADERRRLQVGALPCSAAVELQPVLADPSTSTLADSDDELEDCHATQSPSGGGQKYGVMAGWIGRLRNEEHSETFTIFGSPVRLDSSALWAHGCLCRCLLLVASAPVSTPATELLSLNAQDAAAAMHTAPLDAADAMAPDEAVAVADRVVMLLKRHLDKSGLQSSGLALFKAYHVGVVGATLAHALDSALSRSMVDNVELCSLPVFAVGITSAIDGFLLVECTATAAHSSSVD